MTIYYQQGDVLMVRREIKQYDGSPVKTKLCHKGNNHTHDFDKEVLQDGNLFFLLEDTTMLHFEHKPILLPVGVYEKRIVREYSHYDEEARSVID